MESVTKEPKEVKGELMRLPQQIDAQALIQSAVEHGAGIETLERLVALAKDVRAQQAKEAWHAAIAEFQRTCPPIRRTETANIMSKRSGTSYSYSYAPLGGILAEIQPVMGPLGLSISFRVRHEPERVMASCRVSHEMGHFEESGEVAMPVTDDGTGANPAQRVGIASTYAKRYALLAIIGIAPEEDTDAGNGKPAKVATPRRASEAAAVSQPEKPQAANTWRGQIASVNEKAGKQADGKPYTVYTVRGKDGTIFSTFDVPVAQFAREAGSSPVRIDWQLEKDKYKNIVSIGPDFGSDREVGDEGEP